MWLGVQRNRELSDVSMKNTLMNILNIIYYITFRQVNLTDWRNINKVKLKTELTNWYCMYKSVEWQNINTIYKTNM